MDKPFRSALEALRDEFARAADRHPDLFFEKVAIGSLDRSRWEPRSVCQAFIEANRSQERQEEWHVWKDGQACGRFYGNLAGIEEFKRLAESLHLVLCEMVYQEHGCYERCGFLECMERMYEAAINYPTPLLRVKFRNWGVDESIHDEKVPDDLAEQVSPAVDDRAPYSLHPLSTYLVHNVFASTVAFIDAMLQPDKALLTGPIPSHFLSSYPNKVRPERPPITLPQDSEGQAKEPKDEGATTKKKKIDGPYAMWREGNVWEIVFEEENHSFADSVNFETLARLLKEPGREIGARELLGIVVDVEVEEKAKQARSELRYEPQLSAPAPDLSEEAIRSTTIRIKDLHKEIQVISDEPDIGRSEMIEDRMKELLQCVDYLDRGTRDNAEKERESSSETGEPDDMAGQETIRDVTTRMKKLIEQIHEARRNHDRERFVGLTKELVSCHESWLQAKHAKEEMERRRSRRRGNPETDDDAMKGLHERINRVKKAIADTEKMLHLSEHLATKIIPVYDKPKWKYDADIYWKVEGI